MTVEELKKEKADLINSATTKFQEKVKTIIDTYDLAISKQACFELQDKLLFRRFSKKEFIDLLKKLDVGSWYHHIEHIETAEKLNLNEKHSLYGDYVLKIAAGDYLSYVSYIHDNNGLMFFTQIEIMEKGKE